MLKNIGENDKITPTVFYRRKPFFGGVFFREFFIFPEIGKSNQGVIYGIQKI
jgi:hypothetical protein